MLTKGSASSEGLSLIEVVVAMAVVAIAVLAAVLLQSNALHYNRMAQVMQELSRAAEREMELQRRLDHRLPQAAHCYSGENERDYDCQIAIKACDTAAGLRCTDDAMTARLYHIEVTVTQRASTESLTLATLVYQ